MLTEFHHNSFTLSLAINYAIQLSLNIPPHLKYVATLPCVCVQTSGVVCGTSSSARTDALIEDWRVTA